MTTNDNFIIAFETKATIVLRDCIRRAVERVGGVAAIRGDIRDSTLQSAVNEAAVCLKWLVPDDCRLVCYVDDPEAEDFADVFVAKLREDDSPTLAYGIVAQ